MDEPDPAVIVNIQRQPGANIISVVDRIKKLLPQLQASLPAAVTVQILTDRTITIRASVKDVQFELMLAIALVVMVVFLFLRNLSATVIPSVAVPLSLIGTFGVMYLLGYSLNNLTLMALTISTGFVVDDAIVMIENIDRFLEEGDSPLDAALKGSRQIGFTIISLTVSLIAVLIPLLFMGDIVGRLFREFAVTLAVTILVSAAVSLSLTPMMCAKLLKHHKEGEESRFYHLSEDYYNRVIAFYGRTLKWVLRHQTITLLVTFGTLVLTLFLYVIVPKGFFPVQDTGVILGVAEAPDNISFKALAQRQQRWPALFCGTKMWRAYRPSSASTAPIRLPTADASRSISSRAISVRRASAIIRRLAAASGEGRRHHTLHAARAGPHGRRPRQPHPIPIHDGRCGRSRTRRSRRPTRGQTATLPALRDVASDQQQRPEGERHDRSRHCVAPGHFPAADRQHALRRLRTAPGLHHLHPVEPVPRDSRS